MARSDPYHPDSPSVSEIAAGGVVYDAVTKEVLVLHVRDQDRWGFPKGHVEVGESIAEAARREIIEETGLTELEFQHELTEVHYRFYSPRRKTNVFKTVVYWKVLSHSRAVRLEAIFDDSRWGQARDLLEIMTYAEDRTVIEHYLADSGV
jgi:8-oxo-dGTP pyrophosphatase MutT (NUDIX family)